MRVDGKNIKNEENLTKEKMSTVKILFFASKFFSTSHMIKGFFSISNVFVFSIILD